MTTSERPVWNERDTPTAYTLDVHEAERDYSVFPPEADNTNQDYLAWFNGIKEPLHNSIRAAHPQTLQRLEKRRVDPGLISAVVSQLVDAPAYPSTRVVTAHDLKSDPAYQAAIDNGFYDKAMEFGDGGQVYSQFIYTMHFVRLRAGYVNKASRAELIDSVANSLGHATLAPFTYVQIERGDAGSSVFHWYGYSWRYKDKYFGEYLNEASAAKIAASARLVLGEAKADPSDSMSWAKTYRERKGFPHGSVGALALDVMNHRLGHSDRFGIYRPMWEFMLSGQNGDARDELAAQINKATNGEVALEDLEAASYSTLGMDIQLLEKIEEACQVSSSRRPSRLVKQVGVE
jgi:hypothetical protein